MVPKLKAKNRCLNQYLINNVIRNSLFVNRFIGFLFVFFFVFSSFLRYIKKFLNNHSFSNEIRYNDSKDIKFFIFLFWTKISTLFANVMEHGILQIKIKKDFVYDYRFYFVKHAQVRIFIFQTQETTFLKILQNKRNLIKKD